LKDAFLQFVNKVPFHGAAVLCVDDEPVRELLPRTSRRVITYGLADASGSIQPDIAAEDMRLEPFASRCTVTRVTGGVRDTLGEMTVAVPGRHNLLNALGAVAIGIELQVPFARIASALAEFTGAERRFQVRGERHGVMVVDDYGHHPTEISAVIAAARATGRRLLIVFQPHRYTRTRDLMPEFAQALGAADEVVLTDIYPAGEAPIEHVTVDALAAAVRASSRCPLHVVHHLAEIPARVAEIARKGDLIITLGAGTIGGVGDRILTALDSAGEKTT
jgi:UDP-N-acetylmuramate--alanine ligase